MHWYTPALSFTFQRDRNIQLHRRVDVLKLTVPDDVKTVTISIASKVAMITEDGSTDEL